MLGYNDNMRWGESIETQDESKSFYAKALKFKITSKTRLGCGTKSMLTYPATDLVKLNEIISNDALILRQKAD